MLGGEAQSRDATGGSVAFEVVSIVPNRSATVNPRAGFRPGGRFEVVAATVQDLITLAYGGGRTLHRSQIVGAPQWIATERFDVIAQTENGTGPAPRVPPDRMLLMVQNCWRIDSSWPCVGTSGSRPSMR